MIKNRKWIGMGVMLLTLISGPVIAGNTNGTTRVEITRILRVTETAPLQFGQVITNRSSGTLTLAIDGILTSSNRNYILQGTPGPARFEITGQNSTAIDISFSDIRPLSQAGGNGELILSGLRHNAGTTPTIGPDGTLIVTIGGDIAIRADQTAGAYSGGYTLTVNYQ